MTVRQALPAIWANNWYGDPSLGDIVGLFGGMQTNLQLRNYVRVIESKYGVL